LTTSGVNDVLGTPKEGWVAQLLSCGSAARQKHRLSALRIMLIARANNVLSAAPGGSRDRSILLCTDPKGRIHDGLRTLRHPCASLPRS